MYLVVVATSLVARINIPCDVLRHNCLYFGQGRRIVNCVAGACFRLLTGLKSAVCCPLVIRKLVCLFRPTAGLKFWGGNHFFKWRLVGLV